MLVSTYETIRNTLFMVVSLLVLFNVGKFDWFKGLNYIWLKIRFRSEYILACKYLEGFDEIYDAPALCYLIATKDGLRLHPLYKLFKRDLHISYQSIAKFTILVEDVKNRGITNPNELKRLKELAKLDIIFFSERANEYDHLSVTLYHTQAFYRFNKYIMARADFFEYLHNYLADEKISREIYDLFAPTIDYKNIESELNRLRALKK